MPLISNFLSAPPARCPLCPALPARLGSNLNVSRRRGAGWLRRAFPPRLPCRRAVAGVAGRTGRPGPPEAIMCCSEFLSAAVLSLRLSAALFPRRPAPRPARLGSWSRLPRPSGRHRPPPAAAGRRAARLRAVEKKAVLSVQGSPDAAPGGVPTLTWNQDGVRHFPIPQPRPGRPRLARWLASRLPHFRRPRRPAPPPLMPLSPPHGAGTRWGRQGATRNADSAGLPPGPGQEGLLH